MEVHRAVVQDLVEVLIPLITINNDEFNIEDVLSTDDIHAYYWNTDPIPQYVEADFVGTVGLVIPANGTVYLHRISMSISMFSDIDTSKPIGVAVIDSTEIKVFKDTGFDIILIQKLIINLSCSQVFPIPNMVDETQARVLRITANVTDFAGNKADPDDIEIHGLRVQSGTDSIEFVDGYTAVPATPGVYAPNYFKMYKVDGETGKFITHVYIKYGRSESPYTFDVVYRPNTTNTTSPWQLQTIDTQLTHNNIDKIADITTSPIQLINDNSSNYRFALNVKLHDVLGNPAGPFNDEISVQITAINNLKNLINPGSPNDRFFDNSTMTTPSTESVVYTGDFYKLIQVAAGVWGIYIKLVKGDGLYELSQYDDLQMIIKYNAWDDTNPYERVYYHHVSLDLGALDNEAAHLEISTPVSQVIPEGDGYRVAINMNVRNQSGELVHVPDDEIALQALLLNGETLLDNTYLFDNSDLTTPATISSSWSPSFYTAKYISTGLYVLYLHLPKELLKDDLYLTVKYLGSSGSDRVYNHHIALEQTILDRTIDGLTFKEITEIMLAMANGNFDLTIPAPGIERLTFYKQNGTTIIWQVDVTDTDRTRL